MRKQVNLIMTTIQKDGNGLKFPGRNFRYLERTNGKRYQLCSDSSGRKMKNGRWNYIARRDYQVDSIT